MPQFTSLDKPDSYYEELASRRNPKHDLHCTCNQCWMTPVCCMICKYEFRHAYGLTRHRTQRHNGQVPSSRAAIRARVAQRELIPDGLGYLTKIFVTDAKTKVDTKELSKFATHLQDLNQLEKGTRGRKIRHLIHAATLRTLKEDQKTPFKLNIGVPAQYVLPVYQIWEISGVAPKDIVAALIAYGLEHLAQELRQYPSFPKVPDNPGKKLSEPLPPQKKTTTEAPRAKIKPEADFF
jgi:hypothetical protein